MATRMQQRRGTAEQWTDADPILAAGEIGFETDTSQFKIGDGVNVWSDLSYFKNLEDLGGTLDDYIPLTQRASNNGVATLDGTGQIPVSQLGNLIDGAPEALNTLNEIASMLGDGSTLGATVVAAISSVEAAVGVVQTNLNTHEADTTNIHGIGDTSQLATLTSVSGSISSAISTHTADTTDVHGIADTAELATRDYADTAVNTHSADTTNVHGIDDTALLATKDYADTAVSTHNSDTTNVHGIADTALLSTQSYADTAASSAVSTHNSDTTNVHGIADTAELETQTGAQAKADLAQGAAENYADSLVGDATVDGTSGNTITDRIASAEDYTDSQIDAHVAVTTNVHGIADTTKIVLKDAASTTLDGALVITGDLTVNGTNFAASATSITIEDNMLQLAHQNAANTVDLGLVVGYNDGAAKHSGIVRDVSDAKWKLFKGVTTEPSTTVDFSEGSLDDLALNNLTAAGVVFTDGTQTKEGVVSRTPIIQKTASYTLSSLTERDSMIEVASSSGTTITIPAEASVNYPVGTSLDILQTSTGQVTIAGAAGVTVNATPGLKLRTQWSSATLFKRSADTWVVYGDLMA